MILRLFIISCVLVCGTILPISAQDSIVVNVLYLEQDKLAVQIHNQSDYEVGIYTSLEEVDMQSLVYFDLIRNYKDSLKKQFYSLQQPEISKYFIKIAPHQTYVRTYHAGETSMLTWSLAEGTRISSEHLRFLKAHFYLKYSVASPKNILRFYRADVDIKPFEQMESPLFRVVPIYKPETHEISIEKTNLTGGDVQEYGGTISAEMRDSCLFLSYRNNRKGDSFTTVLKDNKVITSNKLSDILKQKVKNKTSIRRIILSSSSYYKDSGNPKWKLYQKTDTFKFPKQKAVDFFMNREDSTGMYFLLKEAGKRMSNKDLKK